MEQLTVLGRWLPLQLQGSLMDNYFSH